MIVLVKRCHRCGHNCQVSPERGLPDLVICPECQVDMDRAIARHLVRVSGRATGGWHSLDGYRPPEEEPRGED